jgi:hypothetical protein
VGEKLARLGIVQECESVQLMDQSWIYKSITLNVSNHGPPFRCGWTRWTLASLWLVSPTWRFRLPGLAQKKALSNKMSQEGLQHWDPCEAVWRLRGPVRFGSHHQRVIKWKPDIGGWFLQVLDLRMEIKHEFLYIYICIYICIHILSNQLTTIYIYGCESKLCVERSAVFRTCGTKELRNWSCSRPS